MDSIIWLPAAAVLAGVVAGLVLWLGTRFMPVPRTSPIDSPAQDRASNFLLDGDRVVDSDHADPSAVVKGSAQPENWGELRRWLGPRFPYLPDTLSGFERGQTQCFGTGVDGDDAAVCITARGPRHHVALHAPTPPSPAEWHEAHRAISDAKLFRDTARRAPMAIGILGADRTVHWKNDLFAAFSGDECRLILDAAQNAADQTGEPVSIGNRAFEVTAVTEQGFGMVYAIDNTRLMQADSVRNSFIQTLTKTFANLSTGLAVFDRSRRLVLFNPAMIDLTGLSAEFLSRRPDLLDFFDRLRDRHVLPEPRNYATWRAEINDMIETAADGTYSEAWNLPSGLTYRVTGRPHPDGAVAFLIEDITDEMSMTRRSRSRLEMRQAVLDRLEDAVAVFAPDGVLAFCNAPFRNLLGFDPDARLAETRFDDVIPAFRARFGESGDWDKLDGKPGRLPRRKVEIRLRDMPDTPGLCRAEPLTNGFVMLRLARQPSVAPA